VTAAAEDRLISRHRTTPAPGPAPALTGLPLTARAMAAEPDTPGQVEPLGAGWTAVTVVIGIMAALIALGGMVLSFRAVSAEMVPAFGARWAWLVPIVVDLTVFVFSGVDLVLARLDMGHPLARWTVYGATGGTVWLNYSAGGTPAGRVAHVLMPAIWVVFVELMRHVVRRQTNLSIGGHRESIPAARWFLSPWPTLKLWRRMVLWRVNSYPRALDQEKMRLGAVATAREMHGRLWRYKISPLTRLQINLGELGAHDLLPGAAQPAPMIPAVATVAVVPEAATAPGTATVPAGYNGYDVPEPQVDGGQPLAAANGAGAALHAAAGPRPNGQHPSPAMAGPGAHAAPNPVTGQPRPAGARPLLPGPGNGTEPIPGVAAAGAAAASAARAVPAPGSVPTAPAVPAQRVPTATASVPATARQDPPHVEFQAPPPMPPMRRSTRESELLTAAREVERWRGLPSATRISRELGIGMPLATSLANALRDEDGPGADDPAL
jgi:hypothetical protein